MQCYWTLHQIFRKNLLPGQCSFSTSTSTSTIWFKNSYRSIFSEAESKLSNKNFPAFALLQTFPKAKGRTWTTLRNETTLIICVHICLFFIPFWRRRRYLAEEKKIPVDLKSYWASWSDCTILQLYILVVASLEWEAVIPRGNFLAISDYFLKNLFLPNWPKGGGYHDVKKVIWPIFLQY